MDTKIKWKYLTDSAIEPNKWPATIDSLTSKIFNKDAEPFEIFYEILILILEFPDRLQVNQCVELVNSLCSNIPDLKRRQEISVEFLVTVQSFPVNDAFISFINGIKIDNKFKREYLDVDLLKKCGLFKEYGRLSFKQMRENEFTFPIYSCLYESPEGYSKLFGELVGMLYEDNQLLKIDYYIQIIERLIARFQLDTNRCVLLMINVFAKDPNFINVALEIFKHSSWWKKSNTITQVLASFVWEYDSNKQIPELKLITLLIDHGVVDFNTIYNSLKPRASEESEIFDNLYKDYITEQEKKSMESSASALALAAPLVMDDDDDDEFSRSSYSREDSSSKTNSSSTASNRETSSTKNGKSPVSKPLHNHKLQFLLCLLESKMYKEAVFILSQYPFLPLVDDKVSRAINDFINQVIDPYYHEFAEASVYKEIGSFIKSETVITKNDIYTNSSFPSITDKHQLFKFSNEFIKFNQFKIAKDVRLFTKLIRIVNKSLLNSDDKDEWLQYYRSFIFPYLLILTNNTSVVDEAFNILDKFYSMETRYNLYGEFQSSTVKNNVELKLINSQTEKQTKDILKRLSNANSSQMMRKLAKVSYSNPITCSNVFLQQIETYDNLSDLIVDSSRFFNRFGWDSLSFQLCNRLTANRPSMQADGINYNQWLQNLSNFIAKINKKMYLHIDLKPILVLILKSFFSNSTDYLLLFRDIISTVSGIQQMNNLNMRQIEMLNGEKSLRQIVYMVIEDSRLKNTVECRSLIDSLISSEGANSGATGESFLSQFFILLCSLIDSIAFNSKQPLKIVSQRLDDLDGLLNMFITLVGENLDPQKLQEVMVPANELITEYGINPKWVFQIWRRSWNLKLKQQLIKGDTNSDGDEEYSLISDVIEPISKSLGDKINWNIITPKFYFAFWEFTLYDINFENLDYSKELTKLKETIAVLTRNIKNSQNDPDASMKNLRRIEGQKNELTALLSQVLEDEKTHSAHNELIKQYIFKEKDEWIKIDEENEKSIENISELLLEYFVLPRIVHTSFDSTYTFRFLFMLHKLKVSNFSLIILLNNLFHSTNLVLETFFIMTSAQTESFGVFYALVIGELNRWWKDESTYRYEALGLGSKETNDEKDEDVEMKDIDEEEKEGKEFELTGMVPPDSGKPLDYQLYRKALFNWHKSVLTIIMKALSSSNYSTINNAIIFLKNLTLAGVFPIVEDHSELIIRKLTMVVKEEKERHDLILAINAIIGLLTSRRNDYIHMWDFYEMEEEDKSKQLKLREAKKEREKAIALATARANKLKEQQEAAAALAIANAKKESLTASKPYGLVGLAKKPATTPAVSASTTQAPVSKEVKKPVSQTPPPAAPSAPASVNTKPPARTTGPASTTSTNRGPSPSAPSSTTSAQARPPVKAPPAATSSVSKTELLRQRIEAEKELASKQQKNLTGAATAATAAAAAAGLPRPPRGPSSVSATATTSDKSGKPASSLPPLPPPQLPPPSGRERDRDPRDTRQSYSQGNSGHGGRGNDEEQDRRRSRYVPNNGGGRNGKYIDRYIPPNKRNYEYDNSNSNNNKRTKY